MMDYPIDTSRFELSGEQIQDCDGIFHEIQNIPGKMLLESEEMVTDRLGVWYLPYCRAQTVRTDEEDRRETKGGPDPSTLTNIHVLCWR